MAYLSGEGVVPDPAKARRLAERAAELGNASGLVVLGELHFQAGDLDLVEVHDFVVFEGCTGGAGSAGQVG